MTDAPPICVGGYAAQARISLSQFDPRCGIFGLIRGRYAKPDSAGPQVAKGLRRDAERRTSKAQLDAWWDRPYGVTLSGGRIEVRCLNGGAWDRSTHLGIADGYDAACALAEAKQAEWLKFRERPCLLFDEGQVLVMRQAQRPDEAQQQLAAFPSAEAANAYLRANFPEV